MVLSRIKIRKLTSRKNWSNNLNPDFEQNHYSRAAKDFHKAGHDSSRLRKWMAFYIGVANF